MAISGIGAASSIFTPSPTGLGAAKTAESAGQKALDDFNAWTKMTPAQQMRAGILKSMGLSENDLKSMDPKKRQAIEDTIRERIKDAAIRSAEKGKTGLVADVTA